MREEALPAYDLTPAPAAPATPKLNWLSERSLRIHALLNIAGFILIASDALHFPSAASVLPQESWRRIIIDIFLLQNVHIVLTVLLLSSQPVLRWRLARLRKKIPGFLSIGVLLSLGTYALFWNRGYSDWRWTKLWIVTLPVIHAVGQFKGLSLDSMPNVGDRRLAKYLWRAVLPLFILAQAPGLFFAADSKVPGVLIAVCGLLFLLLFGLACRAVPRAGGGWWRMVFQSRLLIFPLGPFSPWAMLFPMAAHGLEYLAVTSAQLKNHRLAGWGLAVTAALGVFIVVATWLINIDYSPEAVRILVAPQLALLMMHYYLDAFLFRHRAYYDDAA